MLQLLNELIDNFFCSIDMIHLVFDKNTNIQINSQQQQQNRIGMNMMRWNKK
jgi:hypothetical protein